MLSNDGEFDCFRESSHEYIGMALMCESHVALCTMRPGSLC